MESSRTNFEVLGLEAQVYCLEAQVHGLEAYKFSKMPYPCLEDSAIFWLVRKENNLAKINLKLLVSQFISLPYLKNNAMW